MKKLVTCLVVTLLSGAAFAGTPIVNEDYKLLASDGASWDNFGISTAISGDTVVVGANQNTTGDSGSAYVYRFDGDNWIKTKLLASDGAIGDNFGISVATSSDTIVVGASGDDDNGSSSGSAYVYLFDGDNWIKTKLLASDGAIDDCFGISVATSGDTVVVGAYQNDDDGLESGSAYVYRFDGKNWIETKLLASDGAIDDFFGKSVATNGDTVVVGAYADEDNGHNSGSAYVYLFDGDNWIETKLLASDGASKDFFGVSVSISGDTIVVGAKGKAYVYRFDGKNWIETKLLASDGAISDWFGISVAISGDTVVVGANGDDDNGSSSGSAYVYHFDGSDWIETKLLASDGASWDNFGIGVATSGDTVVVGASGDDDNGTESGSAYIFYVGEPATTWTVDDDGKADFNTIQAAIDAASNGDEIMVMEGMYYEHDINTLGKSILIEGSINTAGELLAVVHGNWQGSVFVCDSGETTSTVLKNLLITGGNALSGSGMYIEESAPSLVGCTFMNNYAIKGLGGGMHNWGSSPTLTNCTFTGNAAGGSGGGMYNNYNSSPTLTNCTFENNTSNDSGGGMYNEYSSNPTLSGCTFADNTAGFNGGGMCNYDNSGPTLDDCTFESNTAGNGGGGMFNRNSNSSPTLTGCTFENNTASHGGGMFNYYSSPTLVGCTFMHNDGNNGGGINANVGSAPVITYCTFIENSAEYGGGMIIWDTDGVTMSDCVYEGNAANVEGGGVYAGSNETMSANLTLLSCSFTNNTAGAFGGGIFSRPDANTTIIDTLACGNTPDQVYGEYIDGGENTITDECPLGCPDINGDGYVDVGDLLSIIDQWGLTNSPADVNDDGIVDVSDLLIVVGNWGPCE